MEEQPKSPKIIQIACSSEGSSLPELMGLGSDGVIYELTMQMTWRAYIRPLDVEPQE